MSKPSAIPTILLGVQSTDPFPCVDNLWTMYSKKGSRTVFLSVGAGQSALPELELAETLGCPLNYVPLGEQQVAAWEEIAAILKARARDASGALPFSAGAEEKWILPKHVQRVAALPWWATGTADISGVGSIPTQQFFSLMEGICKRMNIAETRLDILKLDVPAEAERPILMAALEAGFRPGIILVRWGKMPNTDVPTTLAAGHLQNCGYSLVKIHENKFAYMFTDRDVYMTCSWEETNTPNPLVKEIVDSVRKSVAPVEGGNNHARWAQNNTPIQVSSSGETAPESVAAPSTIGA